MFTTISKTSHSAIKAARALSKHSVRIAAGRCVVEGAKMLTEAIAAGLVIYDVFVAADANADEIAAAHGETVYEVPRSILETLCDTKSPQGICAVVDMPRTLDLSALCGNVVIFDAVSDPGNVGAILRTARAVGVTNALLTRECADVFSPKAIRASMGAAFHVACAQEIDLCATLTQLKNRGYKVITTAMSGENIYTRQRQNLPFAIIIGNEARGVSEDALGSADYVYRLPMRGGTESLNAAVAAGVFLYELTFGSE